MDASILKAITSRMSLRAPQEASLSALAQALEAAPAILQKERELDAVLRALSATFPKLTDFERAFPSLCFALATGVGKTRLMGAFISYLHLAHGIKNFFVLAPNLTIYNKLIGDFTPNTPKYVFKGIAEFATSPPRIVTGDDYAAAKTGDGLAAVVINIFNISKINAEVRGDRAPRIKRLRETLGESYFDYLANLPDLVMLMDESHRYRASAGIRALNELNPLLGLELTATPFTEGKREMARFKNVIVEYPLARAMNDGFVKEPAVVTQRDFDADQYDTAELDQIKLEAGIHLHENTKEELLTYARQHELRPVKPFMLVIARDTSHAAELRELLEQRLCEGRYQGKVIQVDSSRSGAAEEEMITRLLAVESPDEATEIVIHVNMLKEGWDVTNLYTIVPLRRANARTLIEQSIGRGLRLPYGKRTGVDAVDRLNIVAHDRFQEIVDEANLPDSLLRRENIRDAREDKEAKESVVIRSKLDAALTGKAAVSDIAYEQGDEETLNLGNEGERQIAETTWAVLGEYQHRPTEVPVSSALLSDDLQTAIASEVAQRLTALPATLSAPEDKARLAAVVARTTAFVVKQTIDMPRITLVPTGKISCGYHDFALNLDALNLQVSERRLLVQSLQDNHRINIAAPPQTKDKRLEDYILDPLLKKNDIAYGDHAELLQGLAGQAVAYVRDVQAYSEDELHNILSGYGKLLAEHIHEQMTAHYWQQAAGYKIRVSAGFTPLKQAAYTKVKDRPVQHYRATVSEPSKLGLMLFNGFARCLYAVQKFDSDTERRFAIILEHDAMLWFKPVSGQFQINYKAGMKHGQYTPDFVAELEDQVLMVETKAENDMKDPVVLAKAEGGQEYCKHASDYLLARGGKPWRYLLVPHDAVSEDRQLQDFIRRFAVA